MAKEVVWTKIILETFLEESGILDRIELGDEKARILEGIMRTRCVIDGVNVDTFDTSNRRMWCAWFVSE